MQYNISNDSLTGLKRKVEISNLAILDKTQEIEFYYIIYFFNQANEPVDSRIAPVTGRKLVANNTTLVNSQGDYVAEGTEGAIGEFEFWINFIQTQVFDRFLLYGQVIQQADKYKRFD